MKHCSVLKLYDIIFQLVYLPVMDPEMLTNGTNRAQVLRFETGIDPSFFANSSFNKDPFNEKKDMADEDMLFIFKELMFRACEGKYDYKVIESI